MDKSVFSRNQKILQDLLREVREEAGLRQQDVAKKIGEPQSLVSKYEIGERRLDVLELREVCRAMGIGLADFCRRLDRVLKK